VQELATPISHYTDAVQYGDLIFVSGCAPIDQSHQVVNEEVTKQAEAVFNNLELVLRAAACTFADVLKVTVYLTDVNDRVAVNDVRKRVFGDTRPASTLVGVAALAIPGMKVEVDAVAGVPPYRGANP